MGNQLNLNNFRQKMQKEFIEAKLPELQYGYAALEPTLNSEILEVHHKKHHNTYANNYNNLVDQLVDAHYKGNPTKVQTLCKGVAFNAGGFNVHNIYWENLAPEGNPGGILPDENSKFSGEIVKHLGSYD